MTPEALARVRRLVEQTTAEQGVPLVLEDPAACRKIAALLDAGTPKNDPAARRQPDAA